MTFDLNNKRVVVIGASRSGAAAARFLVGRGAVVMVNDAKTAADLGAAAGDLKALGCGLHLGGHHGDIVSGADLVVVSPGIPPASPPLREAERLGIPVVSEVELAARSVRAPIVAITGTNGKSTVTELVGLMLKTVYGDTKVFVGGNLGRPAVESADGPPYDWIVLEISSYQLERSPTLHPKIAAILNVTEDHLDRYPSFEHYRREKLKIFARQGSGDALVINRQDPSLTAVAPPPGCHLHGFALAEPEENGAGLIGTDLVWNLPGEEPFHFPLERLQLQGLHNIENALAAGLIARLAGATPVAVVQVLDSFTGLPHRMQIVRHVAGMTFIDDSKATNVGSAIASLAGLPNGRVIWIAGGRGKGGDYAPLVPAVKKKSAMPCSWERRARRLRRSSPRRFRITSLHRWTMLCGSQSNSVLPATPSCWPRPVQALICFGTMRSAERYL